MRPCLLAALLGLLMVAPAAVAQPAGLVVRSDVPQLRFVALNRLPSAPRGASSPEFCRHLLVTPRSDAGREVARAGWSVTREGTIGPYTAVTFVSGIEPGTSGACRFAEGNLGIFRGRDLIAIAYAPTPGAAAIGGVRPLEPDMLRLWDGDFLSQPVADLRLEPTGALVIQPLAAEERVCGGKASVPNIYGRPIDQARAMLLRQGWTPAPPPAGDRDGADERVAALVRRGLPEVEDCAGTGFGFCGFNYRAAAGTLSVTTVGDGEMPTVSSYGVACRAPG